MSEDRLPQARLGADGLYVGAQGLGCMGMSEFYGGTDEATKFGTVRAAAALGVGVVPYSPLGRGFLTGVLPTQLDAGDVRTVFPRFTGGNARRNADLLTTRLAENLAAVAVTLTADELLRLEPIAQQVSGDRYPDMQATASARET